jgi:hypothetical protein
MLAKKSIKFENIAGIEQRWKAPTANAADDVTAARVDPRGGGWLFDRGIEPWWDAGGKTSSPNSVTIPGPTSKIADLFVDKVDSLFVWSKQNTEQVYYLVESGGRLYYFWGHNGGTFYNDYVEIDSGRHIPKINEPGTQYIPYGNRLLIINGYNKPLWFYGRERVRNFGFTLPTPAPEALVIQPDYLDGSEDLGLGVAAPNFSAKSTIGLGYASNDEPNNFDYKMTFITDTGSESPLSSPTGVEWQTDAAATQKKFGVVIKHLPIGPYETGVVSRRLYRTKNQRQSTATNAGDAVYYLVNQINDNCSEFYVDIVPDGQLIDTAPSITDTSTIASGYAFGAAWNSSIWLAGGSITPTRIIYSKQGLPEQFGGFDYFDVGNTAGGAITGLTAYYNNLIVFRQRAIDIVRVGNGGMYQVSQLTPEIGTTAINTAKLVAGVGLMFLGYDGIYAITGGLDGGSAISVQKVSAGLAKEIPLINRAALPRATAVYSAKEREYWVHYTQNGFTFPTRGIVYHTDTGQFSLRHSLVDGLEYLWAFTALATDPYGNIIIGTQPKWIGDPFTLVPAPEGYLVGLHVWSGKNGWGRKWVLTSIAQNNYTYTISDVSKPLCVWQSDWLDFDDNSIKHRVFNVEAEIMAYGDTEVSLTWQQDYSYVVNAGGTQKQAKTEFLFTKQEDPVFGPDNGASKNYFTVGSSPLQEPRIVRLRWDVNTGLVDHFKWSLYGLSTFHLLGVDINYSDVDQLPLNQRINTQKGQPQ